MAEDFGLRAGAAVENARLYRAASQIARTLQTSLLPPHLPDVPGRDARGRLPPAGAGPRGRRRLLRRLHDRRRPVVPGHRRRLRQGRRGRGGDRAGPLHAAHRGGAAALAGGDPALGRRGDARPGRRAAGASARSPARTSTSPARRARLTVSLRRAPAAGRCGARDGTVEPVGAPGTLLGLLARPGAAGPQHRPAAGRHARALHGRADRGARPAPTWGFEELAAAVRAAPLDGPGGLVDSLVASALGDRADPARRPRGARAQAGRHVRASSALVGPRRREPFAPGARLAAVVASVRSPVVVVVVRSVAPCRLCAAACPRQAYHRPQEAALPDIRYPIRWSPFPVPTHDRGCRKPGARRSPA